MVIRRELAQVGDRALIQIELVGVSGQIGSTVYQVTGTEPRYFADRISAERALKDPPPYYLPRENPSFEDW